MPVAWLCAQCGALVVGFWSGTFGRIRCPQCRLFTNHEEGAKFRNAGSEIDDMLAENLVP